MTDWIDHERALAGMPPRKGTCLFGVTGHFSAAHRDRDTGELHGHTWHVLAKFQVSGRPDARKYKAALARVLDVWDHKELPEDLAWGEDIARSIGCMRNCVEVEVSRPAEGIYAWWRA